MGKKSGKNRGKSSKKSSSKVQLNQEHKNLQNKKMAKSERIKEEINAKNKKKKRIIHLAIFLVYAIFLIVVACHHEVWRDEAQSWLIAKKLNLFEIISQLKYEGHPFLWYYLLKIFAVIGLNYRYLFVVPVMLNLIATYLILSKSKFSYFVNIVILLSSGLFFYCGVIARSYSLAYLLVVILAIIYQDRRKMPIWYGLLLFLIMNTHILLFGFVGCLVLIDFYDFVKKKGDRKSILISLSLFLFGIVTLVIQFCNTINSTGKTVHFENLKNIFNQIFQLFIPAIYSSFLFVITILIILTFFVYLVYKKDFRNFIILFGSIMFQILFATMIYNSMNASSLIYVTVLFVSLQFSNNDVFIKWLTIIIFGCTLYGTCSFVDNDMKYLFSDSYNASKYIEKNVDSDSKIYCERVDFCAAIHAYLPEGKYHFVDYNTDKEYVYTEYGDYLKILDHQSLYARGDFFDKDGMDYYIGIIYDKDVIASRRGSDDYDLVYETMEPVFYSGESYAIYKHN